MTTQPISRIAALLAATTTLVGAFAACGDTTINNNANCGAGTTLKDGTCVAQIDATADTGSEFDAAVADAEPDSAPQEEPEDPTPDDPCPTPPSTPQGMLINCDSKCGTTSPMCLLSTCTAVDQPREPTFANASKMAGLRGPAVASTALDPPYPTYFIVRLPRNPAETIQTCSPKVQEEKYPNQVKRPKFMFGFVAQYQNASDSINGCTARLSGTYLANVPPPYNVSVNMSGADTLTPWELLTHELEQRNCMDICAPPPWVNEGLQAPVFQTSVFYVNGKVAAKNMVIGLGICK